MRKSLGLKVLSAVAVGIVLAHLCTVATGMLLCIGDGADPDCCPEPRASRSGADDTKRLLDASDCGCCITVDAAPSTASATAHKASLDVLSASVLPRGVVSPTGATVAGAGRHGPGNPGLASLRTVVLLI